MSKAETDKETGDNRRKGFSKKANTQSAVKNAHLVNGQRDLSGDAMQQNSDIPKFDLAEQIMAEHRKITAIRRKGPGKLAKPPKKLHPAESIAHNFEPHPILSEQGQIIADIVARDIKKLCKGKAWAPWK